MRNTIVDYYGVKLNCIYQAYRDIDGEYTVIIDNILVGEHTISPLINEDIWEYLEHLVLEQTI
jgi:hypothetical protein